MLDIPIVKVYRKIRLLESVGLLRRVGTLIRDDGKTTTLFLSQLDGAELFYSKDRLKMRLRIPKKRVGGQGYRTQK